MVDLYNYGEREFEAFGQKVTEATEWRKRKETKHRDGVLRSLDALNECALRMELCIAIENRPHYYQIPDFDEVGLFFEEFSRQPDALLARYGTCGTSGKTRCMLGR